ncbi:MAG: YkgJ family cysteine cluster protein, partial [Fretibacterium sp.]|nr:YkgJ family cysteine cluster protein [Fretibacterium sp.]
ARCSVYPVRPSQCRLFPFWPELLRSREMWELYAARCPGMNEGPLLSPAEIEAWVRSAGE